ncbi:MAG: class I SAM-dependent methyltransferase [Nitrospiria bacterium]
MSSKGLGKAANGKERRSSTATLSIFTVKATPHKPVIRQPNAGLLAGFRINVTRMSKPELISAIGEEIAREGPIPFIRYMEMALYHPEYGYYASPGEKIGWKGDYYTSSSVHPVFGELIAKQLTQMGVAMCQGGASEEPFTIVEMGAGKGTLCFDILNFIQRVSPPFFDRLHYVIVEGSHWLREKQIAWLAPLFPRRLRWEDEIPKNLEGVVLSNELLDAFPVHRLRVEGETVQEIYVDWRNGRFAEVLRSPSTHRLSTYLRRLNVRFNRPTELEINLVALDWMRRVGRSLARGFVVTIDYGYPAATLYTPRRPKGTFLCYYKHTANENPYEHVGEQDMTAHVDFTSLAQCGEKAGLKLLGFTDQTHFLMGLGIAQRMEGPASRMNQSPEARRTFLAMRQLMAPEGMGKVFKILIQGKNVPSDIRLDGLQFKPFFKFLTFLLIYLTM